MEQRQSVAPGTTAPALRTLALLALLGLLGCAANPEMPHTRPFFMGFTPFPWDISPEAVTTTNEFITQNGDIVSHHLDSGVPWPEALEGKPFHPELQKDWDRRKEASAGRKVFLSVTPLNTGRNGMALYRAEKENMPLPDQFRDKALDDPLVKTAYLNYCRRAVEHFRPDYLAIGIEVNELFHHSPAQWPALVTLYRDTYAALKQDHPALPIFATVTLHNLTNPGWKDREEQQEAVRAFLQYNDMVGISYYPFMAGQSERPNRIFDWLRDFADKPIAITETGFPAETIRLKTYNVTIRSNPAKQAAYFETLLARAAADDYIFVIAFLYRDYDALWEKIKADAPEAFIVWKDCGLVDESGARRPACEVWQRFLALPRKRQVTNGSAAQ